MLRTLQRRAGLAALGALVLAPTAVEAQFPAREWRVAPMFGAYAYDDASPLESTPYLGGEVVYPISNTFGFGLSISFARPLVDGDYFEPALFRVAEDTLLMFSVGQQASQITYAALGSVGLPLGRVQLYANAGVGGYTFFLDPQANEQIQRAGGGTNKSGLMIPFGGGVILQLAENAGIRLDVRDEVFTDFDRDFFNPVEPRFRNRCGAEHQQNLQICFPELNPNPPEASSTLHNLRFTLGFEFLPGI